MFKHRSEPLAPASWFALRMAGALGLAFAIIALSLVIGMWGYHHFESMPWVDAFVNASMILSGMGPLGELKTEEGKVFAGLYALYSGLAIITITGITLAPVVHRFLHRMHADLDSIQQ